MTNSPNVYQHPELDGRTFFLSGSKAKEIGLLFFHGFTATTVEVRKIAIYFHTLGYTVSGPLLPGHGTTPEDMNSKSIEDWVITAENAYLELKKKCSRVIVFGESMGGLLTLLLASKHPEIEKLFVFSPALKIDGLWQSFFAWPFVPYVFKKNTDESMLWQGYNVVPLRAATQLLKLQKKVKALLPSITTDALIFQGRNDHTINPLGTIKTYNSLGSKQKRLIWLEESSHCILLDKELPQVMQICEREILAME
jgi:carboxylesterase